MTRRPRAKLWISAIPPPSPFSRNVKLTHGSYADCAGSRLVIITAGAQIKQGQSRDELALINARITVEIARELEKVAPEAIFLLFATNPVDLVTRFVIRNNTRYPAERVISRGCVLDSARFMKIVGDKVGLDPKNVMGYVLGEHGKNQLHPLSITNIGGLPMDAWCDMVGRPRIDHSKLLEEVKQAGFEIFQRSLTITMAGRQPLPDSAGDPFNEGSILPVGVLLEGQYGIEDCVLSVPTLVDNGVARILEYPLTAGELAQLRTLRRISADTGSSSHSAKRFALTHYPPTGTDMKRRRQAPMPKRSRRRDSLLSQPLADRLNAMSAHHCATSSARTGFQVRPQTRD